MRMLNDPARLTEAPARFTTLVGRTYTIALKYATGKLYASSRPGLPDNVMYTLTDGRRAWLPVPVAELVDRLALAPGEMFTICNHGTRRGWEVKRAETAPEPATAAPETTPAPAPVVTAASVPTKLEGALKTAIQAAANAEKFAASIGYSVRFDAEAIKAMAITLVINSAERAR